MSVQQGGNFSNQATPSVIADEYVGSNFTQAQPVDGPGGVKVGVRLFPGDDTPRTFRGSCNLTNCHPPPGSVVDPSCNTTVAERGIVSSAETVTVDGDPIVLEHHVNRIHGRYDGTIGAYVYLGSPIDVEVD